MSFCVILTNEKIFSLENTHSLLRNEVGRCCWTEGGDPSPISSSINEGMGSVWCPTTHPSVESRDMGIYSAWCYIVSPCCAWAARKLSFWPGQGGGRNLLHPHSWSQGRCEGILVSPLRLRTCYSPSCLHSQGISEMKAAFFLKIGKKKKKSTGFFWERGESPCTASPHCLSRQRGISCLVCKDMHVGGTHALGKATQKRIAADPVKKEASLFFAALFIRSELPPNHWVDAEMKGVN